MISCEDLKNTIERNIPNSIAIIESPDNVHFDAIVISDAFDKVINRVKRQKIVYNALGDLISSGQVHALSLRTYTKKVYESLNK